MESKTRREETARLRREKIVEAAVLCFIEKGFHRTSIRDIASRAGISLGNLYNHFESKDALIREIAALEAGELDAFRRELSDIDDPIEALNRFVKSYAKACAEPANALLMAEVMSEGLRNPAIRGDFLANRAALVSTLVGILEKITADRKTKFKIPAPRCAEFLIDMIDGFAVRFAFAGEEPGRDELAILEAAVHQQVGV